MVSHSCDGTHTPAVTLSHVSSTDAVNGQTRPNSPCTADEQRRSLAGRRLVSADGLLLPVRPAAAPPMSSLHLSEHGSPIAPGRLPRARSPDRHAERQLDLTGLLRNTSWGGSFLACSFTFRLNSASADTHTQSFPQCPHKVRHTGLRFASDSRRATRLRGSPAELAELACKP